MATDIRSRAVRDYDKATTAEKQRWVRWAMQFASAPRPLVKPDGSPTRYAQMFQAWGEGVPKTVAEVKAVHAKAVARGKGVREVARDGREFERWERYCAIDGVDVAPERSLFAVMDRVSSRSSRVEVDEPVVTPSVTEQPSLILDNVERERSFVTMSLGQDALVADDFLLKMTGRLVQAETANANGAFWSVSDLEYGLPSVATGPLNWLHQERKVVGTITDARLVGKESAESGLGPHIAATSVMWKYLYEEEAGLVERAAEQDRLWYSMECVSREIACTGPTGCGKVMPYVDSLRRDGECCEHVRERSSSRRFIDPVFFGAALILPPVAPGWANAHVDLMREAASQIESGSMPTVDDTQVAAMILGYVRAGSSVA